MPNWCNNTLTIKSKNQQFLEEVQKAVQDEKLLTYMVPPPDTDDYNAQGWYNWNCANWGTKWDICDPQDGMVDGQYECNFNTAWAPPIEAIENWFERAWQQDLREEQIGHTIPDDCEVIITYYEGGMCFCGVFAMKYNDLGDDKFHYCLQNDKFTIKNMEETQNHANPYVNHHLYQHIEYEIEDLKELEEDEQATEEEDDE